MVIVSNIHYLFSLTSDPFLTQNTPRITLVAGEGFKEHRLKNIEIP